MSQKTAVLIFTNSPEVDEQQKGIYDSRPLFEKLNKSLIQKVKRTGLPYYIISDKFQRGQNFGDRFFNAINYVIETGFGQIITVGNDTPQLQSQHILRAHQLLCQNKTSIGPSVDGGFYLLGIHKNTLRKLDFKNLAWQTSVVFTQIKSALKDLQEDLICFNVLNDIDDFQSLKRIQGFTSKISNHIESLISTIIKPCKVIFFQLYFSPFDILSEIPYNKGSPGLS